MKDVDGGPRSSRSMRSAHIARSSARKANEMGHAAFSFDNLTPGIESTHLGLLSFLSTAREIETLSASALSNS
jgi:hypothetical protein